MKYHNRRMAPCLRYFEGNLLGLIGIFCSLVWLIVTRVYAFIKFHQTVHFLNLYFNIKIKFITFKTVIKT